MGTTTQDPDWMVVAERALGKAARQFSRSAPAVVFLNPGIPSDRSEDDLVPFFQRLTKDMAAYTKISALVVSVECFDYMDAVRFAGQGWQPIENSVACTPLKTNGRLGATILAGHNTPLLSARSRYNNTYRSLFTTRGRPTR